MFRTVARTFLLCAFVLIVGTGGTSQSAWAQDKEAPDARTMLKECEQAEDPLCIRDCKAAVGYSRNLPICRSHYDRMVSNRPKPLTVETVPEHYFLQSKKHLLETESETRAQFEEEFNRVKPGLVYKPYSYWAGLLDEMDRGAAWQNYPRNPLLQTIRDTFDGIFYTKDASISDFPLLYRGFTYVYGRRCKAVLENPISITRIRTETDRNGFETKTVSAPFIIEQRFHEKFKDYERVEIDYGVRVGMRLGIRGASMGSIAESLTRHENTVDKVLAGIAESGCTSATMRQLRMNFWLRANGRPSLQESGERIAGAEAESQIDVLQSEVADFDAKMALIKDSSSNVQKYSLIDLPAKTDGEGTEITYLFAFRSPHSWLFDSHVKDWLAKNGASIEFDRVPYSPGWYAPPYFSARKLGIEQEFHDAVIERIHVTKRSPESHGAILEIFARLGVSSSEFEEALHSPDVKQWVSAAAQVHSRYRQSDEIMADYPAFLVNRKYRVSTGTCECGPEEMLAIVSELIQKTD